MLIVIGSIAITVLVMVLVVSGGVLVVHGLVNNQLAIGARSIWVSAGFVLCLVGYSVIVAA